MMRTSMAWHKTLILYALVTAAFLAGTALILREGQKLPASAGISAAQAGLAHEKQSSPSPPPDQTSPRHRLHTLLLLAAQITAALVCAKIFGFVFKSLGQPSVLGEITAGLFLGPSVLGYFFPDLLSGLFPSSSLHVLEILSLAGVSLFMFLTGMEIDTGHLKKQAFSAVLISHTGILFPFFLGAVLSYFLYASHAPKGIAFAPFCLFMGIAMSITAFPVLAKILKEKNLSATPLGILILGCAAADDVTAWVLLAGITAFIRSGSPDTLGWTAAASLIYVLLMLKAVKPFLRKRFEQKNRDKKNFIFEAAALLMISSAVTEAIGIHALFGAFIAGAVLPRSQEIREGLERRVESAAHLLLPLFFVLSGLKTQLGLIHAGDHAAACGVIVLTAVAGKFGGTFAAARLSGMNTRESLIAGSLMNTRGLMELIVLNIGLDLGVLSPAIFTMMVVMALVTTFMTSPIVDSLTRKAR